MSGEFTPTTQNVEDSYAYDERYEYEHPDDPGYHHRNRAAFRRWLAAHDREVAAKTLREALSDFRAYTDSGAPFGHRPVEEFLEARAARIEQEGDSK